MKKKRTALLLIIIFLVLGSGFGMFSSSTDTAMLEEAGNNYFNAVRQGNYTEAYYAFTSKSFQKETSLESFKKGIRGYTLFEEAGSIQFNKREVDEDTGFLQGVVKSIRGTQAPIALWFIKEDDDWKLDRMEAHTSVDSVMKHKLLDELKGPVIEQISAIQEGDFEKAYYTTLEEFQKKTDLPHFKQMIADVQKTEALEFFDLEAKGKEATLDLCLYSKDKSVKMIYELMNHEGHWKIFGMSVIPEGNE